jgi:hypothetical protein
MTLLKEVGLIMDIEGLGDALCNSLDTFLNICIVYI